MKKLLISLFSLFMIAILIGGFVGFHFVSSKPSDNHEQMVFEVAHGKSFTRVAKELESIRIVQNANLFTWYARFRGEAKK